MLASDVTPMALVFAAMCGSPSPYPDDEPTSTGFSCYDYNMLIKVEFFVGRECSFDAECDQVIPVDDDCPTADRVVSTEYDASYLFDYIEEAESVGCTVRYPGDRGDCDPDAEPVCDFGVCTWM